MWGGPGWEPHALADGGVAEADWETLAGTAGDQ